MTRSSKVAEVRKCVICGAPALPERKTWFPMPAGMNFSPGWPGAVRRSPEASNTGGKNSLSLVQERDSFHSSTPKKIL